MQVQYLGAARNAPSPCSWEASEISLWWKSGWTAGRTSIAGAWGRLLKPYQLYQGAKIRRGTVRGVGAVWFINYIVVTMKLSLREMDFSHCDAGLIQYLLWAQQSNKVAVRI